jgi:hypothetical protein
MAKFSYRFDGSSFTGQKYAYVGPSSAPCRKVNPLGDVEMISTDEKWQLSGNDSYIYDKPLPEIHFYISSASDGTNAQLGQYYGDEWHWEVLDYCPCGSSINVQVEASEYLQQVMMLCSYFTNVTIIDQHPTIICYHNSYSDFVNSRNYAGYIDMEKPIISPQVSPLSSTLTYRIWVYGQEDEIGTFPLDCPQYPMRITLTNNIDYGTSLYGGFVREIISSGLPGPTYLFAMRHDLRFYIPIGESFSSTMSVNNPTIKLLLEDGSETTKYVYPMTFELLTLEEQEALCPTNKIYTF